jgi:hypothetical protein
MRAVGNVSAVEWGLNAAIPKGGAGCEIAVYFWAYLMEQKSPKNSELFSRSRSVDLCSPVVGQADMEHDPRLGGWTSE